MPTEQTATVTQPVRYVVRRAWSDRGGPCGWDVFIAELDDERIEQLTWCNRYATRDDARSAVRELDAARVRLANAASAWATKPTDETKSAMDALRAEVVTLDLAQSSAR